MDRDALTAQTVADADELQPVLGRHVWQIEPPGMMRRELLLGGLFGDRLGSPLKGKALGVIQRQLRG
jgi:hypothetical protein